MDHRPVRRKARNVSAFPLPHPMPPLLRRSDHHAIGDRVISCQNQGPYAPPRVAKRPQAQLSPRSEEPLLPLPPLRPGSRLAHADGPDLRAGAPENGQVL